MEWMQFATDIITILIVNGVFFYTINRKLKKLEVEEKKVDITKKQDDEWQELYFEEKNKTSTLDEKISKLYKDKSDISKALLLKDLEIEKTKSEYAVYKNNMEWYECTRQGCANRIPPHVFDDKGLESVAPKNKEKNE